MKKLCPTCCGRGSIVDPKCNGMTIGYCGPNGETVPMIMCQTCGGSGWIYTADDFMNNYVCAICKKTFNLDTDQSPTIGNGDGCCSIGSLIEISKDNENC